MPLHLHGNDLQWAFNSDERQAYHYIISLQMDKAAPLITSERPASAYLNSLKRSITIIIDEDPALIKAYHDHIDDHISLISSHDPGNPYKNFYLAEIYLQRAFVNLKLGNEWSACWDFRRSYKAIKSNILQFPDFIPNYKSMGLLHIIIGSVPEQFRWIMSLMGLQGSVTQGLEEMQQIAQSDHVFNVEAQVIQHLLEAYLLNRSEAAVKNFEKIYDAHHDNKLFGYLYISLLIKNAQSADALRVLNHIRTLDNDYLPFNFLHYIGGELYLQKGDYPMAEIYFSDFIRKTRGRNFTKDAYYKLFLTYWLQGNETKAIKAHQMAQSTGQEQVEADKHAAKNLSEPQFPNKVIIKIRLFTDGGFYNEAEKLLQQRQNFHSKKEKIEYVYRKARLYHKMGSITRAVALYTEAIESSVGEDWYFAPNACLQLGYIFNSKNDTARAKYYFNQVITYQGYEYKASLDNKAKIALAAYEE